MNKKAAKQRLFLCLALMFGFHVRFLYSINTNLKKPMETPDQNNSQAFFLRCVALSGMLAVILGAFGAHGLKAHIPEKLMQAYQTGVLYHFIHTLALGLVALLMSQRESPWLSRSAWSFLAGIILFSGSLYLMALSGVRALGMVTPLGGVLFIVAWLFLFLSVNSQHD